MFVPQCTPISAAGAGPRQWMIVLHGIYGRGGNWRSFARKLCERRPDWGLLLTDLRMHGASMSAPPPHTLEACARDVLALIDQERGQGHVVRAVLGHSFGGKVALEMRRLRPDLGGLWIIDSSPSARPEMLQAKDNPVVSILAMLRELPTHFASREVFVGELTRRGLARGPALWLAMNLEPQGEGYRNTLQPAAMRELLQDYAERDLWTVVEKAAASPDADWIRFAAASTGSSIPGAERERLRELHAPERVSVHVVEGGHWLHVDALNELVALVADSLG